MIYYNFQRWIWIKHMHLNIGASQSLFPRRPSTDVKADVCHQLDWYPGHRNLDATYLQRHLQSVVDATRCHITGPTGKM